MARILPRDWPSPPGVFMTALKTSRTGMRRPRQRTAPWAIPSIYTVASLLAAITLPRLEHAFLTGYTHQMSTAAAMAFLSAAASGMLAFTAIVFSIAFVMMQFSAIAYSPRLVLWFAANPALYHTLGLFIATFTYSMATLLWTDRGGSGAVPLFSTLLVLLLLSTSMIAFSRLVQGLSQLQITDVLALIGDKGRSIIAAQDHFLAEHRARARPDTTAAEWQPPAPAAQTLLYRGPPRSVAGIDFEALARLAERFDAVLVLSAAVGDTLVAGNTVLHVYSAPGEPLPEPEMMAAFHIARERTFEQDPKYALRLLADIAIKALSPAINDPTTAVQAIDQIEDLLRRLAPQPLGNAWITGADGSLRVLVPMPTWDDYLALAFDETRQYGAGSIQVMRRLRAALLGIAETATDPGRRDALAHYLTHLDRTIQHSELDTEDQATARQVDLQGLGLTRSDHGRKTPATKG